MKKIICVASRGRNPNNPNDRKNHSNGSFKQKLEISLCLGKTNALTTVDKDNWILIYEEF